MNRTINILNLLWVPPLFVLLNLGMWLMGIVPGDVYGVLWIASFEMAGGYLMAGAIYLLSVEANTPKLPRIIDLNAMFVTGSYQNGKVLIIHPSKWADTDLRLSMRLTQMADLIVGEDGVVYKNRYGRTS